MTTVEYVADTSGRSVQTHKTQTSTAPLTAVMGSVTRRAHDSVSAGLLLTNECLPVLLVAAPVRLPGDLQGRVVDITVPGNLTGQAPQKHSFTFDKVFAPTSDQAAVFEEISELIQSALDGHKVRAGI